MGQLNGKSAAIRREKIFELRKEGLSYKAIAEKLGVAGSTVAYYANPTKKVKRKYTKKVQTFIAPDDTPVYGRMTFIVATGDAADVIKILREMK